MTSRHLNAAWQRDLAVSHHKLASLAEKAADQNRAGTAWQACFTVLDSMKQRGMQLDPPIAKLHEHLARKLGGK